jgi:anti-anti-sigma regulatory factor
MEIVRRGELTLAVAQNLGAELAACREGGQPVVLDLEGVTEVDLACLQVLLAAERSFVKIDRPLQIRASDSVRRAWTEAGFPARGDANAEDHPDGR